MNIFELHSRIIGQYEQYVESFLEIADDEINTFAHQQLIDETVFWPDPLIQLNPSYKRTLTVEQLVLASKLHPKCADIFRTNSGTSFHLYQHQTDAMERAAAGADYIVTSGTGSGKSLSYFIPIFDSILKHGTSEAQVHAIVVYPMNALVNSQELALDELAAGYQRHTGQPMPVRYARYTGQEKSERKAELQKHPPHIILTNYVMLELMLVRQRERKFVDAAATALRFLVFDELHTYRGRQGADVGLLIRRLKERANKSALQCIGTSATMASGDSAEARRQAVADFAGNLFGSTISADNVIEETLERLITRARPLTRGELAHALHTPLPDQNWAAFAANPLSFWIEATFGLRLDPSGHIRRQTPLTLSAGAEQLAVDAGVGVEQCATRLREMLLLGSRIESPVDPRTTVFAFKLHQFISQGESIYATLQQPEKRLLTLDGQYYAPGKETRFLYPLRFCRACGQAYYGVRVAADSGMLLPDMGNQNLLFDDDELELTDSGYIMIDSDQRWQDDIDALPDHWRTKSGSLNKDYKPFRPKLYHAHADGSTALSPTDHSLPVWFVPQPFMLCLNCGEAYTRRDKNDFRKLARLSSEGRSTATTLLSLTTAAQMRKTDLKRSAQKVLSFTDNRQDASLQAGHFNDFVQVAQLRAALYQALAEHGELTFEEVAPQVVGALGLELADYGRPAGTDSEANPRLDPITPQGIATQHAFRELIAYRLYDDLQRGWRVVQPNLEQAGLLTIRYSGLAELAAQDQAWASVPYFNFLTADERRSLLTMILDEMRRQLAIDVPHLLRTEQDEMRARIREYLHPNWAFDADELLRYAGMYILPDQPRAAGDFSLSTRGVIGRWLRQTIKQRFGQLMDTEAYTAFITRLMVVLNQWGLTIEQTEGRGKQQRSGYRLRNSALIWCLGDGAPTRNPLRRYRVDHDSYQEVEPTANSYFHNFYKTALDQIRHMEGAEHTAQIDAADREEREERFRAGALDTLFCSPTMELGVDISDLNVVHLRNMPPTPANYAQRSGRAGRAGQPALILAYSSAGSGHDQYYFRNRVQMVAGIVVPPRIELNNEDLICAHMHAIWLAHTGLDLQQSGHSITELINIQDLNALPLLPDVQAQAQLSAAKQTACINECQRVLTACGLSPQTSEWLHTKWLSNLIQRAPETFDGAFNRWRELFRLAWSQFIAAQQAEQQAMMMSGSQAREQRRNAENMRREAQRQLDLLRCQNVRFEESDFFPYRYLASEGFLPGYNFPALPIRAYLARGSHGSYIARPRFLALSEFGPDNIIYHNGAKYQVKQVMLPLQEPEKRFLRAKLCQQCGYIHPGEQAHVDICVNCGNNLHSNSLYSESLLEMPTVKTVSRQRITSDEEERLRRGYDITTHLHFATANGKPRRVRATARPSAPAAALHLTYAPAASLWRINHRWRRQVEDNGYRLALGTGQWVGAKLPPNLARQATEPEIRPNVRLAVRDTANALLVRYAGEAEDTESFLATLQYALARGIQETYQVEASELASERIGEGDQRALLFWESAEGGLGVLKHIATKSDGIRAVARTALKILHFDPDTGKDLRPGEDEQSGCARACYECLLSYYNQRDHIRLNRHLVRDYLRQLMSATVEVGSGERDYEAQYHALRAATDPDSTLERQFLDYLYQTKRNLPDEAQKQIDDIYSQPDFFYEPDVCVFCDGTPHDEPQQKAHDKQSRRELKDGGYRVIAIRYDAKLETQIAQYTDIFGEAQS
ncbi:MAG: DEAD/DEAH box helicase [Anaerolineae bacterium]|nr:DEAD/DEAH box helicase [Anaerolineae bacterium]